MTKLEAEREAEMAQMKGYKTIVRQSLILGFPHWIVQVDAILTHDRILNRVGDAQSLLTDRSF